MMRGLFEELEFLDNLAWWQTASILSAIAGIAGKTMSPQQLHPHEIRKGGIPKVTSGIPLTRGNIGAIADALAASYRAKKPGR